MEKLNIKKVFAKENEEVKGKIERIMNALVGIDNSATKRNEEGQFEHFEIHPIFEERKSITESMEEEDVPGLCIALINNFAIEWVQALGLLIGRQKSQLVLILCSKLQVSSKSLVATVVLNLVEKGLLNLDEPVNKKLEDWQIPSNKFTQEQAVTIRQILSHTSGINSPKGGFSREEGLRQQSCKFLKGNHLLRIYH